MTRFRLVLLAVLLVPGASAATVDGVMRDVDTRAPSTIGTETFLVLAAVALAVIGGLALAAHALIARHAAATAGRLSDDQREALRMARAIAEESPV